MMSNNKMPPSEYEPAFVKPFVNGDTSQMGNNSSPTEEEQEARRRYVERTIEKRSIR